MSAAQETAGLGLNGVLAWSLCLISPNVPFRFAVLFMTVNIVHFITYFDLFLNLGHFFHFLAYSV